MISSLLYVTTSRLDVMQAVGQVARFQETPKETHVTAVNMIFTYIKGATYFGICHPKEKYFTLVSYTYAD